MTDSAVVWFCGSTEPVKIVSKWYIVFTGVPLEPQPSD